MNAADIQPVTPGEQTQSAFDLFLQALQQNPNSSEAHFGAAISLVGFIGLQYDGVSSVPGGEDSSIGAPAPPMSKAATLSTRASNLPTPTATVSDDVPPAPDGSTNPGMPVPAHYKIGFIWNLTDSLSSPYALLRMLSPISDIRAGLLSYYGYGSDDVAGRQKMLADLDTAAEHLSKVEADPNFTMTLPIGNSGKTVTIGLPEVYLFDGYVQSLRAELNMSLAYIRDPGANWKPSPQPYAGGGSSGDGTVTPQIAIAIWSLNYLDKNSDGKLSPDEYLPPSPYLTLREAKYLTNAQQAMLNVVDRESRGIDGVFARAADAKFLVPNTAEVHAALLNIQQTTLVTIKQAANGPVTLLFPIYQPMPLDAGMMKSLGYSGAGTAGPSKAAKSRAVFSLDHGAKGELPDGTGSFSPLPAPFMEKITINIAAWFAAPPVDLKAFAPTVPLTLEGWPQFDLAVFPDKTFGGLFPNGLPVNLPS